MKACTIGQVARQAGLKPSAVRYYESHGIIPRAERLSNGYRVYPGDTAAWLRFITRAQALGTTLKEAKQLLALAREGQRPCDRVRELARTRLQEINARIRGLQLLRAQLRAMLRRPVVEHVNGTVCPMIEAVGVFAEPATRRPWPDNSFPGAPTLRGRSRVSRPTRQA